MSWEQFADKPQSVKIYIAEISVADSVNPSAAREVLRFSSEAIKPVHTDHYYEPCIKTLPVFNRSLQSLTFGRTSATFGTLVLLMGGGHLDPLIAGKLFAGSPVTVKSGFEGLNVSEFKELFTGRIAASPSWSDSQLTVPLTNGVGELLEHKLTEQKLSGALPTVLSTVLDAAGVGADKRDSSMWDVWKAENSFNVWFPVSKDQTVASVLDALLPPLGCWFGFDRTGKFQVSGFGAPAEGATPSFELTDLELTSFSEKNHGSYAWKVTVSHFSVTGDNPETADVSWEDTAVKDLNPSAVEISRKTALTSATDASTIRDRWKNLFAQRRLVASATAKSRLFSLELGDVVRVTRDRLDLNNLFVVQNLTDDLNRSSVSLELFR
ncbi:hypothetical protein [Maridesulfovibrio sp. FT414]|uniref:hypothetical protein n=1 Tax=Maridesulfovibrio sp. FT414 TaxID=2979469 RepID=UPI003D806E55